QQNVLTDARRDELIGEIDALDTEIKRRSEDLKKAFNQRIEDFTKRMNAKMAPLFQKFAQDNQYAAILYLNPQVIAFLNPGADVTDTVIALYNQTYPAAAPAAPATPAKK
ncbi:MAG TPA: OmpH family outer membrane protein, partial [Acidobacteriota bacterium]|nr:OmpH family outer membrane protein [Acidobacteriota bacterium]